METTTLTFKWQNFLALLLLISTAQILSAQVSTDFESGSVESWRAEGDGNLSYNATGGNPGGCIQANDAATGSLLLTIAPLEFLGDWSAATSADFIQFDLFPHIISGSVLNVPWVLELSNENNRAIIDSGYVPTFEAWNTLTYNLDPANWTMVSGNWNDLMSNVAQIRIRTEFINGDEWVRIDNFGLSLSPVFPVLNEIVCSNFENGLDGWSATGSGGVSIDPTIGNPDAAIRINDQLGPISLAIPPTKFLGDWTMLNGTGIIGYDMQLTNFSGALLTVPFMIEISGPGGTASIPADPDLSLSFNNWHRFEYKLDSNLWTISAGSWSALLARVEQINVRAEFINGSERCYMDNFCLGNPCGTAPDNLSSTVSPLGILLDWDSQALEGVIAYRISGGPVGGPVGARFVFEPNSEIAFPAGSLAPGVYQWSVIGGCSPDGSLLTPTSEVDTFTVPLLRTALVEQELEVFPNPAAGDQVYFTEIIDVELYNLSGMLLLEQKQVRSLDISGIPAGLYLLRDANGHTSTLVIGK